MPTSTGPGWPPPTPAPAPPPAAAPPRPSGWYQAADGRWYETDVPPAPGWWLASDLRWYPPVLTTWAPDAGWNGQTWDGTAGEPWRRSTWGLGDVWWGALVYVVASLAIGALIAVVIVAADPGTSVDELEFGPYAIAVGLLANVLAFAGIPYLASRRKGMRSLAADFGLTARPLDLAIGFGLGVATLFAAGMAAFGVDALLGVDESTSNIPVDDLTGPGEVIVFFLAVAVITPIIEELFFRGLLARSLAKRGMGRVAVMIVTTIVFVLPHLLAQPSWPNIAVLATAITVYGLGFHLACLLTDNRLGAPIVAHMVVNATAVLVLALQ